MKTDKSATYLGFISDEYEELRHSLDVESFKRGDFGLDEDIFHDTILKCVEKIKYAELTKDQVINYVFVSYNTNALREKEYARNKYRDKNCLTEEMGGTYDLEYEYGDLLNGMKEAFGEHNVELFLQWLDGASVREINEQENIKNFRYTLEKMRKYAKEHYK